LSLREHLYHADWLPEGIRPVPPPPPPQFFALPSPDEGIYGYARWLLDQLDHHRALTAATVAFFGTGGYLYYSQKRLYLKKRRATRSPNGMRKEVVVVAGQVDAPVTRSVMLDLERRGFICYVIVKNQQEVEVVKAEGKADLLPLRVDVTDVSVCSAKSIHNCLQTVLLGRIGQDLHSVRMEDTNTSLFTSHTIPAISLRTLTPFLLHPLPQHHRLQTHYRTTPHQISHR